MQPKISIVIPVYNAEKYLAECLDSVVNQTMHEIQIICVNDGSLDHSRAILQEYADRDSRIEIIDKPNGGQASARNAAYSRIRGKYTYFVDADDWLEHDLGEKTYQKAEKTNAEITLFLYYSYNPNRTVQNWHTNQALSITPSDKMSVAEKLPILDLPSAWCKLFRTDFLQDNKIMFPEGLVHDDTFVNWQAVTLAKKIAVIPEQLYHYRHTPGSVTLSISRQSGGDRALHMVPIYNKIQNFLHKSGYYAAYRDKFISAKLGMWFGRYQILPASLKPRFAEMIRDSLTEDDRKFYRDSTNRQLRRLARLFYAMIDGGIIETIRFRICVFIVSVRSTITEWLFQKMHPIDKTERLQIP